MQRFSSYFFLLSVTAVFRHSFTAASPVSVTCDFEDGSCGWTAETCPRRIADVTTSSTAQSTLGAYHWTVGNQTPDRVSGPFFDHTYVGRGGVKGHFVYASASDSPPFSNNSACLSSSPLSLVAHTNLSFWFLMNGRNSGTLSLWRLPSTLPKEEVGQDQWEMLWSVAGPNGRDWKEGHVDVKPGRNFKLIFLSTVSDRIGADVSIDDIVLGTEPSTPRKIAPAPPTSPKVTEKSPYYTESPKQDPTCTDNLAGLPSCNFDKSECSYSSHGTEGLTWRLTSGPVGNILEDWAPGAKSRTQKSFMYLTVNDTTVPRNSKATLSALIMNTNIPAVCVEFHYAISGSIAPTISLYLSPTRSITENSVFIGQTKNETTEGQWRMASFSHCRGNAEWIVLESEKLSPTAFVAVDYLKISHSTRSCSSTSLRTSRPTTEATSTSPSIITISPTTSTTTPLTTTTITPTATTTTTTATPSTIITTPPTTTPFIPSTTSTTTFTTTTAISSPTTIATNPPTTTTTSPPTTTPPPTTTTIPIPSTTTTTTISPTTTTTIATPTTTTTVPTTPSTPMKPTTTVTMALSTATTIPTTTTTTTTPTTTTTLATTTTSTTPTITTTTSTAKKPTTTVTMVPTTTITTPTTTTTSTTPTTTTTLATTSATTKPTSTIATTTITTPAATTTTRTPTATTTTTTTTTPATPMTTTATTTPTTTAANSPSTTTSTAPATITLSTSTTTTPNTSTSTTNTATITSIANFTHPPTTTVITTTSASISTTSSSTLAINTTVVRGKTTVSTPTKITNIAPASSTNKAPTKSSSKPSLGSSTLAHHTASTTTPAASSAIPHESTKQTTAQKLTVTASPPATTSESSNTSSVPTTGFGTPLSTASISGPTKRSEFTSKAPTRSSYFPGSTFPTTSSAPRLLFSCNFEGHDFCGLNIGTASAGRSPWEMANSSSKLGSTFQDQHYIYCNIDKFGTSESEELTLPVIEDSYSRLHFSYNLMGSAFLQVLVREVKSKKVTTVFTATKPTDRQWKKEAIEIKISEKYEVEFQASASGEMEFTERFFQSDSTLQLYDKREEATEKSPQPQSNAKGIHKVLNAVGLANISLAAEQTEPHKTQEPISGIVTTPSSTISVDSSKNSSALSGASKTALIVVFTLLGVGIVVFAALFIWIRKQRRHRLRQKTGIAMYSISTRHYV